MPIGLPAKEVLKFQPTAERKILTVSELNRWIKECLEGNIAYVWVCGEISGLNRRQASGHVYFTLKDAQAQIKVVMWKNIARYLKFNLEDGMEIYAYGKVSLYEARGDCQLYVEKIEPKGIGALQIAYEQLKERLAKEGLFDEARKRPLPMLPSKIGIVTSLDGAALHDILKAINTRFPKVHILVHPARVQGEGAAEEIAAAIAALNLRYPDLDVLIVGRGGGSLEDLWAFNEEVVARAIYKSHIPVISAVGHEVDYTIADFVADVRARTPTHAGEIVVPKYDELVHLLQEHKLKLKTALQTRAKLIHKTLEGYKVSHALNRLPDQIRQRQQRLDEMSQRIDLSLKHTVRRGRETLASFSQRLVRDLPLLTLHRRQRLELLQKSYGFKAPEELVQKHKKRWVELNERIKLSMLHQFLRSRERVQSLSAQLENLSPLAVLARGYSITSRANDGKILRTIQDIRENEEIISRLARGVIHSRVTKCVENPTAES